MGRRHCVLVTDGVEDEEKAGKGRPFMCVEHLGIEFGRDRSSFPI